MIQFKQEPDRSEEDVNLTPLIDIIFNLLIFFLITASISTKGINLDIPDATTASKVQNKSWEIAINEDKRFFLNGLEINANQLENVLQAEKQKAEDKQIESIVLKGHKNIPYGLFVKVMDTVRAHDFIISQLQLK